MLLQQKLIKTTNMINDHILKLLPKENHSKLLTAIHYSTICTGKRIRPFLMITVAEMLGIEKSKTDITFDIACALEFIHIYSLIHDDLPAMDNDDFRRGQLTCHKKFDEATAILAGDTLLTYAFEILSNHKTTITPSIQCQLINIITKAIGYKGMAGGQMLDLEAKNHQLSQEQIFNLHYLKTGKLLVAAISIGAVLGNAKKSARTALINYGNDIGLAFQIRDDILDFEEQQIIKKNKPDPANIVNIIGLEKANKKLESLNNSAISHLKIFNKKARILEELANFITNRVN